MGRDTEDFSAIYEFTMGGNRKSRGLTPHMIKTISYLGLGTMRSPKKSLRDIAFDLPGRFPIARWAPIPLRLIVGFGFMEHGLAKLSKGPDAFAAILQALAVPAPHFTAWASILTELLGGLAILLGAFVSLVSLPMAALLLVAIFTVHLPYGFSSIKLISVASGRAQFGPPGYECNL